MSARLADRYQPTMLDAHLQEGMDGLQSHAGKPRRKPSEGKATWPGVKQVWRQADAGGSMRGDSVQLEAEPGTGQALLQPVMRAGRRTGPAPTLDAIRRHHAAAAVATLPPAPRALAPAVTPYPVRISAGLRQLAVEFDAAPC
jgi:nicotinate phosphoribosyltransferase